MKSYISKLSLSHQLALVAAGLSFAIGLALVTLAATSSRHMQLTLQNEYGTALAQQIARSISSPLETGDLLSVSAYLQRFVASSSADEVTIFDVEGKALGQAGKSLGQNQKQYQAAVTIGTNVAGTALITLNIDSELAEHRRLIFSLLGLVILLSLAAYGISRHFAQRLADHLGKLTEKIAIDSDSPAAAAPNEIERLTSHINALPMDLLRARSSSGEREEDYQSNAVVYLHLTSLMGYVDTLDQHSLHRYTERLHQVVYSAAGFYAGELYVARQFGLAINFSGDNKAGSAAFRAASCAWLIKTVFHNMEKQMPLSMSVAIAISQSELGIGNAADIYPGLYMQHTLDELQALCASQPPNILLSPSICEDLDISTRIEQQATELNDYAMATDVIAPYKDLLERQFRLIWKRLADKPRL